MAAINLLVTAIVFCRKRFLCVRGRAAAHVAGAVAPVSRRRTLHPVTGAKTFCPLASFVVLAYAISWGWTFPFAAAGDVVPKGCRLAD